MDYFTLPVERSGQLGLSVSFYGSMKPPVDDGCISIYMM